MSGAPPDAPGAGAPDVVIAGAGMAGVTLALALKSAGLDPVLIDPTVFSDQVAPTFDGRASAISLAAFRQWRAVGAAAAIEPHAEPIRQILVTDGAAPGAAAGRGGSAFLRFDPAEIAGEGEDAPLGYMVENRHIRAGLAGAVHAAGIAVLAPARVERVEAGPGSVRVILEGGRALTAPLIVGADGRASLVRREAGIETFGWDYPQTAVVATVALERDHAGVAYEHFLPAGPFAILPLPGRRASLVWTERKASAAALREARDEVFLALLRRRFGGFLGRIAVEGPRFFHPLSLQIAQAIVAPRTALIGDAAHAIHPIAGQGLNMGLKDAAALAEVIVEAARLGEDIGGELVLARYARWRGLDNTGVALATDVFNRLFSSDFAPLRAVRGAGLAAVNRIGPARRFFMREAGGQSGDLPRLLRGEAV